MTEEQKDKLRQRLKESDAEQAKLEQQVHEEAMKSLSIKLQENMRQYLDSPKGEQFREFVRDYATVVNTLDEIIKKKLPTHETAAEIKTQLASVTGDISYIIATTGGRDEKIQPAMDRIFSFISALAQRISKYADYTQMLQELAPELEKELKKPEYGGKDIDTLYIEGLQELKTTDGELTLLDRAVLAAQEAKKLAELPEVKYNRGREIRALTDKLPQQFFSITAFPPRGVINGQMSFTQVVKDEIMYDLRHHGNELEYGKPGAKQSISLFYDYHFDEKTLQRLGLDKGFDDQDYFIMTVFDNLYYEGNTDVTLSKIWREMGNDGSPGAKNLTELYNRIVKGISTIIAVNDIEVQTAWGNDKSHELISQVIPAQIISERFIANGRVASGKVHITGYSPFMIIGQSLGHYGTWTKDILRLYKGRRTKRYYSVLRYLMLNIGWMRNAKSKRSNKITYKDLYRYTDSKTSRAQQLTRNMMETLLNEVFIPTGYVEAYKEDTKNEPGLRIITTQELLTEGQQKA